MAYKDNVTLENITDIIDGITYTEVWENINGFEELYAVSSFGRVKSYIKKKAGFIKEENICKQKVTKFGYCSIILSKNAIKSYYVIHRLVAIHFIDNKLNLPQVNHKKGIKIDNFYKHLEWCTCSQNQKEAHRMGLKDQRGVKNNGQHKLNDAKVLEIMDFYKNNPKILLSVYAEKYHVSESLISMVNKRKIWTHI